MRPSRLSLRHSVVSVSGSSAATRSASSPPAWRTSSAWRVRFSGATTWIPRLPLSFANGVNPRLRSMSASASAPVRISSEAPPGGGGWQREPVRALVLVTARVPDVRRDAVLLGDPAQRFGVVDHPVRDVAALAPGNFAAAHPRRRALRERLLDDDVVRDPLVPAPHVHRPVARVRDHDL